MALPEFSMRELLEAGVHFGHHTHRWNPRMEPFIFGARNKIHIMDLSQTVPLLHTALSYLRDVAAANGRVLFVGTKRQASDVVRQTAERCGQYYVAHRWLGGMLTNWTTISKSIRRLLVVEEQLASDESLLTKKELLNLTRERDKLERALGGIKEMGDLPDAVFIVDTNKEHIAVLEAQKLGIPIVAILDSNSDPVGIDYPIPGNDDATRAINFYCDLAARAVLDGIQAELSSSGADIGAVEEPAVDVPAVLPVLEPAAEPAAEDTPETVAPETVAPETAAPETAAPETAAPETTETPAT